MGNKNLIEEGLEILKSILNDLEYEKKYDVDYLVNPNIDLPPIKYSNKIILNENLFDWIRKHSMNYDYCLFVAPENDLIQYKLTKILEENHVKLLTSNSECSYICSKKDLTYNAISNMLKIPSIKINTSDYNMDLINEIMEYDDIICKPPCQTASDFIYHTKKSEIKDIINIYKDNNLNEMLIQEYIDGENISVSVIVVKGEIYFLSINLQIIDEKNGQIYYRGCESPLKHRLEDKIKKNTYKIINSIKGLNGFVGIDYIIREKHAYLVEINSRITTPYVVLSQICEENLTRNLIEWLIYDKKMKKLNLKSRKSFIKEN